jgi:hypothetical protein
MFDATRYEGTNADFSNYQVSNASLTRVYVLHTQKIEGNKNVLNGITF